MEYRLANDGDANRLSELRWDHKNEESPLDHSQRDGFIAACSARLKEAFRDDLSCHVATDKGRIVSNIYVVAVKKVPKPGKLNGAWGYVTAVYTVPEYRNKGVGSMLMKKVKEWGRENGLESFIVWPSQRSVPFYERAGFDEENDVMELVLE